MAESSEDNSSGIPKETTNLVRLFLLIQRATEAVRVKFDEEFNPAVLQEELNKVKPTVLERLKIKRCLRSDQWLLLFPVQGSAKSSTFDLSLMTCLIKNLTSIEVGDMLPLKTNISVGADISRMKYYRNILYHNGNKTIIDDTFQEYWTDISEGIVRLGGPHFMQICRNLKGRKLHDCDNKVLTKKCSKGMKFINEQKVGEWKNEKVIETLVIKQMNKLVETEHVLVGIGPSGCGKSTAIHQVAIELQRRSEFSIEPAYSAREILNNYNPEIQQVFVIDDLCGKATIDTNKVKKWDELSNEIKKILNTNKVKILASCRTHIYKDRQLQTIELLRRAPFDFLSEDYCLTYQEKRQIANLYLTEKEVCLLLQCSTRLDFEFFPLLCYLYSKNRTPNIVNFFTNPVEVFRDELNLFWSAADQKTYGALMVFIVLNNSLPISSFDKKSMIRSLLAEISDGLHLDSQFTIKVVKSELENLQKSYVKILANEYSIIHDKIFDILVCFCGEKDFDHTINIAHTDVIRDRFVLKSLSEQNGYECRDNVLMIPVDKEEHYLNRLLKDIKGGFLEKVFLNKNLDCSSFRQRLINEIKDFNDVVHKLSKDKIYFLLLTMLHKNYCDVIPFLITGHVDLNKVHDIGENPLFIAVNAQYSDIVDLFLKNNADPNIPSWYTSRSMHDGAHNSVANVGHSFQNFSITNHLRNSCASDRKKNDLLKKRGSLKKIYKKTPLYIASLNGSTKIVEMLLKHNADPNIENDHDNVTPLYVACAKGYAEIVTLLLNKNASSNFCDKLSRSCLFIATQGGCYDIVKLLLENKGDPNTCSKSFENSRETPLQIASERGIVDVVKLLLQYKAYPDLADRTNKTALYLATAAHQTAVVEILLDHGANHNTVCRVDNKSPLNVASEGGYDDIVMLFNVKQENNSRDS